MYVGWSTRLQQNAPDLYGKAYSSNQWPKAHCHDSSPTNFLGSLVMLHKPFFQVFIL
jgi:hypothetical protein